MVDYVLKPDEYIITEADDVTWASSNGIPIDKLVLTSKNILISYSEKDSFFSRPTQKLKVIPLANIKTSNGNAMVGQIRNWDYGVCLQVNHLLGEELFHFDYHSKRKTNEWVDEICMVLGNEPTKDISFGGLGGLTDSIINAAETAMESVSASARQFVDDKTGVLFYGRDDDAQDYEQNNTYVAETVTEVHKKKVNFCPNCGAKAEYGAKFCAECGSPLVESVSVDQHNTVVSDNSPTRQQEFAGKVYKCPACGEIVSQMTAVCPSCGHHITGRSAVSSVQKFSEQLMALESKRKGPGLLSAMSLSVNPVDKQKLSLIRSFPIPNTIDDIQEFMLLAIANIDVNKSKKTFWNKLDGDAETENTIAKIISDAWISKMKQSYQKARVSFPDDPAFTYIKQLYVEKMRELKMETNE